MPEYPDYMNTAELNQACVEYLADLYADKGILWNPWSNDRFPLETELTDIMELQAEMVGRRVQRYMEDMR